MYFDYNKQQTKSFAAYFYTNNGAIAYM